MVSNEMIFQKFCLTPFSFQMGAVCLLFRVRLPFISLEASLLKNSRENLSLTSGEGYCSKNTGRNRAKLFCSYGLQNLSMDSNEAATARYGLKKLKIYRTRKLQQSSGWHFTRKSIASRQIRPCNSYKNNQTSTLGTCLCRAVLPLYVDVLH